ncbi:MAG: hypothetical protein AB1405_07670 [Bdellovibrionota bacterium]
MPRAVKKRVTVQEGGLIEIRAPELPAGTIAKVIVVPEAKLEERKALARELSALFKETQSLPQSKVITEQEIAEEIAAYRT